MADTITTISPFLKNFLEEISGKRVILTPPGMNIKPEQKPKHIYEKYGLKGEEVKPCNKASVALVLIVGVFTIFIPAYVS